MSIIIWEWGLLVQHQIVHKRVTIYIKENKYSMCTLDKMLPKSGDELRNSKPGLAPISFQCSSSRVFHDTLTAASH